MITTIQERREKEQTSLLASEAPLAKTNDNDALTELPSDTFPAPKAPPPTEVTHAFNTQEGEAATAAAGEGGGPPGGPPYRRLTKGLEEALAVYGSRLNKAGKKRKEKAVRFVAMSFFTVAFAVVAVTLLLQFGTQLGSLDSIFPQNTQPQDVPKVLTELLTNNKVVVFLADDCLMCMAGLKELRKYYDTKETKPLAILLTGHRLEAAVRSYLERNLNICRLPAIVIDGRPYSDFSSAIESISNRPRQRSFSLKSGGSVGGQSDATS